MAPDGSHAAPVLATPHLLSLPTRTERKNQSAVHAGMVSASATALGNLARHLLRKAASLSGQRGLMLP
jgi:hypothetical protein